MMTRQKNKKRMATDYVRVRGWESDYESMGKLLRHLMIKFSKSEQTKISYSGGVNRFCNWMKKNSDELLLIDRQELEEKIEKFLCSNYTGKTANDNMYILKKFFDVNRIKDLELPYFYQPSRGGRKRKEYIPTLEEAWKMVDCAGTLKAKAIVAILAFTGLRNGTLRALKYGVVKTKELEFMCHTIKDELGQKKDNIALMVYPEMKDFVPAACKDNIPYYVFTPSKVTQILKDYINDRKSRNGRIADDEFLFPSDYRRLSPSQRRFKPLCSKEIENIVREAARRAGIKQWEYVRPHGLRKVFKRTMINQDPSVHLDTEHQEFFMGHILGGSMEHYYDPSKLNEMRDKFSRMNFEPIKGKSKSKEKCILADQADVPRLIEAGFKFIQELANGKIVMTSTDYHSTMFENEDKQPATTIKPDDSALQNNNKNSGECKEKIIYQSQEPANDEHNESNNVPQSCDKKHRQYWLGEF